MPALNSRAPKNANLSALRRTQNGKEVLAPLSEAGNFALCETQKVKEEFKN